MKILLFAPAIFALASAVAVSRKVDYSGYKVVRLDIGEKLSKVESLIDSLGLSTWNGGPKENSKVDIVVPASKVADFDADTKDFDSHVMHEDLGASIAQEADYPVYAGRLSPMTSCRSSYCLTAVLLSSRQRKFNLVQYLPCIC